MLGKEHATDLEALLFFHPQQGRFRRNIITSVEKYGSPKIIERHGGLRIQLQSLEDVQTLYAVVQDREETELVGAMVYSRTEGGTLEILHIVVKPEYTVRGEKADEGLTFLLVDELCRIGRKIQGIHSVRLAYQRGRVIVKQIQKAGSQSAP